MMTTIVACAVAALIGIGSWMFYKADNHIEQAAEEYIKKESGVDIDLSPNSPEVDKK